MKKSTTWLVMFLLSLRVFPQQKVSTDFPDTSWNNAFRVYLDNDFINLRGHGSDESYTNGIRLDYFHTKPHRSGLFGWLPRSGPGSVSTEGWSAMQVMYSPEDLKKTQPDSSDFPYSGGLFISHSLHSANPVKKYSFRSELTIGAMGPPALAEEMQRMVHRVMGFITPMGWDYQLKTDLLVNLGFTAEKMLKEIGHGAEIIGGADVQLGSMYNATTAYLMFRTGRINPWFDGLLSQTNAQRGSKKFYYNVIVSPKAELLIYNSLVDGGLFRRWGGQQLSKAKRPALTSSELNLGLDYGFSLSWNRLGLSVIQRSIFPTTENLPDREYGNISVYLVF